MFSNCLNMIRNLSYDRLYRDNFDPIVQITVHRITFNRYLDCLEVLLVTGVVNNVSKTQIGNKGKEDAVKTKSDATSEATTNNIAAPAALAVDRYCFFQGNWFRGAGDSVCVSDVLPALYAE